MNNQQQKEEKRDWWGTHGDGVVYLKYATEEYMDMNFEEWGAFEKLIDSRKEEEEEKEELICKLENGGGCGAKGWKLDSGAIQFGCECGGEEEE